MYLHSQGVSDYEIPKWNEYEVLKSLKSVYRCRSIEDARLSQLSLSHSSLVFVISLVIIVIGVIVLCRRYGSKKRHPRFLSNRGILLGGIGGSSNTLLSRPNVGEVLPTYRFGNHSSSLNS